uniref:Reverse transcriptase domain-containing protein n=1 Tax=Magallana gigas TaxID=29159 RepID=A0A8W8MRU8_MAGGI
MLKEQNRAVVHMINSAKSRYYQDKRTTADSKETFRVINSLMNYNAGTLLPSGIRDHTLADEFDKVQKIRIALLKNSSVLPIELPTITDLVNASLSIEMFPDKLKRALVIPRLKKTGLDTNTFSYYRTVSNIPFISKVIERIVAKQLNNHLTKNGLHDNLQLAYKSGTSTETTILRIKADKEEVLDEGHGILLVLLDLSAAFDTIDHSLLLEKLQKEVGFTEIELSLVQSYLNGRTQAVKLNNSDNKNPQMCHCPRECPKDLSFVLFFSWCTFYHLEE